MLTRQIFYTLKSVAGVYYSKYKELEDRFKASRAANIDYFLAALELEDLPDPPETVSTLRYVADCLMLYNQTLAMKIYTRLLPQMKQVCGSENNLTMDILLRVANYYVLQPMTTDRPYDVRHMGEEAAEEAPSSSKIDKWTTREEIMLSGLTELQKRYGVNDTKVYIYVCDLAKQYWREGQIAEGVRLFKRAVEGLIKVAGRSDPRTEFAAKTFFEFYIAQDQIEGAEGVAQQVINRGSVIETSSSTNSNAYWMYNYFQGKLANLNTPGNDFYWEDSRIYLCSEIQISLLKVFPEDPFPSHPIRIRVQTDELAVDLFQNTRTSSSESGQQADVSLPADLAQRYQILHFLESKRREQDWGVFGHDAHIVRYITDVPHDRIKLGKKMHAGQSPTDMSSTTMPIEVPSFLIFPEEHGTQQILKVSCHFKS
jgi:hypothetical protein